MGEMEEKFQLKAKENQRLKNSYEIARTANKSLKSQVRTYMYVKQPYHLTQ